MKKSISIITVCYNAEACIEKTLESMRKQGDGSWEYIVIDGNSQDGTLTILNAFKGIIDTLIVEADEGIYDAMNKALAIAKGEYLFFLNAGDYFVDEKLLTHISKYINNGVNNVIIVGDQITESGKRIISPNVLSTGFIRRTLPHQAIFVRKDKHLIFDIKYKIASDFDMLLSLRSDKELTYQVNIPISFYDTFKLDKNPIQRLNYNYTRSIEKVTICWSRLQGIARFMSCSYYLAHAFKYFIKLKVHSFIH